MLLTNGNKTRAPENYNSSVDGNIRGYATVLTAFYTTKIPPWEIKHNT